MIVRSLAEIEGGLKGVDDAGVWKEDDGESQGLLPLLRKLVPVEPAPTWEIALALRVAFDLGKAAVLRKVEPAALLRFREAQEAQRRGAVELRKELIKRSKEWKAVARQMVDAEVERSTDEKVTKDICAKLDKLSSNSRAPNCP